MDRGAWWGMVQRVEKESDMTERKSNNRLCTKVLISTSCDGSRSKNTFPCSSPHEEVSI